LKRINVYGVIIPNDYKWYFDWFDEDSTCPRDVNNILNEANGEEVEVYINSPGGIIEAGSEIYTMLREYQGDIKIKIVGQACSAASIIAMAGKCEMSPTALMMVHCVSTYASGNHSDMEHTAEVLRTADDALSNAYIAKTGMSKEEVLAMMEEETWLTAEQAKEKGLIDGIMFEEKEPLRLTASNFELPNEEKMNKIKAMIEDANKAAEKFEEQNANNGSAFLISKLSLLRLKGERNE
jgi:ATP-dependent Clp protease protease subunit